MPDDDEKPPPNSKDWHHPIDPNATFPPSTIPTDDPDDYKNWARESGGWRKLRAAATGGAAMANEEGRHLAAERVNPQSLMDTGGAFDLAGRTFGELGTYLRTHSRAIAGEDKPWQGPAADGFLNRIEYLAKILDAQAERISGPPGTGTSRSIPQQLYNDANALAYAQYAVKHWDQEYARIAREAGNPVGDTGLVAITGFPQEFPMAQEMAAVIDVLARQYDSFSYGSVVPVSPDSPPNPDPAPPPPPPPPGGPKPPPPSLSNLGGGGGGGGPNVPSRPSPPDLNGLSNTALNGSGANGPNLSTLNPPAATRPNGGVTNGPKAPSLNPPTPPNPPNPLTPNLSSPKLPAVTKPNGAGANAPGTDRPAGSGGGRGGGSAVAPPSPPKTSTGPVAPAVRPPALPNTGAIGSGVNVPGLPGASGVGGIPPAAPPGSPGGSGGGSGVPDRPDASGLLEGDADAWTPGGSLAPRPPDTSAFTPSGGIGLQSGNPAAGAAGQGGMPMMPGSPASGSPGGGSSGVPDRPDAAGLVEGDGGDWAAGAVDAVDGPAAPSGAIPGSGLGLDAAKAGPAAGPAGTPMMPGIPGGGAPGSAGGSASGVPDRPDASGLVTADGADWAPAVEVDAIEEPEGGSSAGGAGLTMDGPVPAVVPAPPGGAPVPATPPASLTRSAASAIVQGGNGDWSPSTEAATDGREQLTGALPHIAGVDAPDASAAVRPKAAGLLDETTDAWGGPGPDGPPDDVVPLLRLDDADADVAAWGDAGGSWLLADRPGQRDETDDRRRTDG